MFEARLSQGHLLKKLVEAMKELVNEANLECSEEGLKLQAMDSSHVSLISLKMGKEMFDEYRCDRNLFLGLSLQNLSKILKCSQSNDAVTLSAQDEGDSVTIAFSDPATGADSKDKGDNATFELKLMDIDGEHLAIPDTEYKASVTMPAGEFQRICRDLATIGDTCTISIDKKDSVRFSVKGDLGNGTIERKKKEPTKTSTKSGGDKDAADGIFIAMEDPVDLTFALRYLNFFCKASPLSSYVRLHMQKGVPLMVEFRFGENEDDGESEAGSESGALKYYLAPKIDEEAA